MIINIGFNRFNFFGTLILILALFFSICGCTPVPTHPQLTVEKPKKTRSGSYLISDLKDLSQLKWWLKIHDPNLTNLIKEALANSNDIKIAEAHVLEAKAQLRQAQYTWLPTLGVNANGFAGYGFDTKINPEGALAATNLFSKNQNVRFKGYYSGFMPNYSLNILANLNNTKLTKASLELERASYLATRLSIIGQVSGSYFMMVGQKAQLNEQRQLVNDLKELRKLEYIRYKKGASDLSIITSIDQKTDNNQASLLTIKNSISQVENTIKLLINKNPGPIKYYNNLNKISINGLIVANIPSSVIENRPDFIIAKQNLIMSEANIGLAYSNFFPNISLTGLLGGASLELTHLLNISTGLFTAEAAASMPLLNGNLYEGINVAKAQNNEAFYNYIKSLRSIFADIDNNLTNQQLINAIYKNKLSAFKATKKSYFLVKSRFKAGAIDKRDLVNAKINLDSAKIDLIIAKMQQLDSFVQVYQALAGGIRSNLSYDR